MTVIGHAVETSEHVLHREEQERRIEALEEIIRTQADDIATLNARLVEAHLSLEDAVALGTGYAALGRALGGRVHGGQRA